MKKTKKRRNRENKSDKNKSTSENVKDFLFVKVMKLTHHRPGAFLTGYAECTCVRALEQHMEESAQLSPVRLCH